MQKGDIAQYITVKMHHNGKHPQFPALGSCGGDLGGCPCRGNPQATWIAAVEDKAHY